MIRICFVCLGNICRSPTAEGVMKALVRQENLTERIAIESAGTGAWHIGERPDRRSAAAARERGYVLSGRAQQFSAADFARFDYVLAMDRDNRRALHSLASTRAERDKIYLFRSFDPSAPAETGVPDPYYGGERGFEEVLDICERACRGLIEHLIREHRVSYPGG